MEDAGGDARPSSAEEAFALLIELQESGTAPEFEAWVHRYPEWEQELRRLHEEWRQIDAQLEQAYAGPTGPDSPFLSALAEAQAAGTAEVAPPSLQEGSRIGEFTLVRPIAQGGMGQVWEAVQGSLQRRVALKLIRPDRIDQRAIELFEREARAGGRINDPRIVTVHATGETGGVRWIAQEYVAGERTLTGLLAQMRAAPQLPPGYFRRIAGFFADTAEAMAVAHAEGVVHRDLKPANILVTVDEGPKVTDFGLARLQDETSLSGPVSVAGTAHYMSPEQVAGKLFGIDARTDVFSLGAVLYEALTLRRPFDGQTTAEVFSQISVRDPEHPRKVRADVPAELAVIALKALEKRPRDRYAGMAELAADLRRFLADEPIRAHPPGPLQRARKWAQRHPTVTLASALLVVLCVALVLFVNQATGRLAERKQHLATQILWDFDDGQLDQAGQKAQLLLDLDPSDPLAHLLMAQGNARFLRLTETEEHFDQAVALGFRPDDPDADSSEELYLRALYQISLHTPAALDTAAELLHQAIEQDEEFDHAWFPLYQVRRVQGDIVGALEALEAFSKTLRRGDEDRLHVVDALSAELKGDHATALGELEALRTEESYERLVELRAHRHLGRNRLQLYLKSGRSDPGLLDTVEADLRVAVDALEKDAASWAGLGLVELLRLDPKADSLEQEDRITQAEVYAEEALEHDHSAVMALEVLADAAHMRLFADFDTERPDEDLLEELERRLEDLERLEPHSETALSGRSDLLYCRAAIAKQRGNASEAQALFQQSVQTYDHQLRSRVMLAQALYLDHADFAGALDWLLEARGLWEQGIPTMELADRKPWERRWGFTVHVWIFGTADQAEDPELAREARDRALEWLDAGDEMHPNEQLSLAEFLAVPVHAELADCGRALDIVEVYGLQRTFELEPEPLRGQALAILDLIAAACPQ